MARYKPYNYQQGEFIPIQFEKQILPDSFEHALNYIIDNVMDVKAFVERIKNDDTGAPAYDPKIMLKIIFYAYSKGIMHSRKIERACQENVMFMALSANTRPHFTTIANFIATMSDGVEPMFLAILMYCDKLGLIGKEMFAIDGCKISSNASKEWSGTKEDFERKRDKYKEAISFLVKKHQEEDEKKEIPEERKKEAAAKEGFEEKIKKIEDWLSTHDDKIGKQGQAKKSHVIDNESAKMTTSHGVVQGYNGVAAVDSKKQIIVVAEAFGDGSEQDALKPMVDHLDEVGKKLGKDNLLKDATLTADSGYHTEDNMKMLSDNGIDAYVPDNQFRKRDPRYSDAGKYKEDVEKKDWKYYSPHEFKLDEATGKLICPAGKYLYVKNRNFMTQTGHYGTVYMAKVTDCRVCPLRLQCLQKPTTKARQVCKFEGRDLTKKKRTYCDWMKERIDSVSGRFIYSHRMGIVEPVFANIRHMLGLDRFTLRGEKKVNAQWKMYAMVHNIFKIYRYDWKGPEPLPVGAG